MQSINHTGDKYLLFTLENIFVKNKKKCYTQLMSLGLAVREYRSGHSYLTLMFSVTNDNYLLGVFKGIFSK